MTRAEEDRLFEEMMAAMDRIGVDLVEKRIDRNNRIMAIAYWGFDPKEVQDGARNTK